MAISTLSPQDWVKRLHENLPYPLKDVLMCNLYLDKNSQKVLKGESLKKEVIKER